MKEQMGGAQSDDSGASTVKTQEDIQTKSQPRDRYKEDMLKFKDRAQESERKAQELEERLADLELQESEKAGNLEKTNSLLKEELKKEKLEKKQMKFNFANARLDEAIKTTAAEKGLKGKQLEAFMKLVDKDDKSRVEFDEKFNVQHEEVAEVVTNTLNRYSEVFTKRTTVVDGTPNQKPVNRPSKGFDLNKASAQETLDYLLNNKDKLK